MRIFVTGWQGQVARALLEQAPSSPSVAVCSVGRPALDVSDPKSVDRALSDISPTVVINTAAYTAVDKAESEPDRAFALNRDGARQVALATARRGIPIIHLSTDYVFDGTKGTAYIESDETSPRTVYGQSKLAGERAIADTNPNHIILRTAWVFSPFGSNFLKTMLRRAKEQERLEVVADQRGSPTYAPHLATLILEVARRATTKDPDGLWGTYHLAGGGSATWHALAVEIMAQAASRALPSREVEPVASSRFPAVAPRLANAELDCGKIAREHGLALPPWQQGVAEALSRLAQA